MIGETSAASEDEEDEILVLEANLDDVSAQIIGHVYDALFEIGAMDVYTTPIHMKKNRPGTKLTVLVPPHIRDAAETILFAETTTFGIRMYRCTRRKLAREFETVQMPAGSVRIKVGRRAGRVLTAAPEYDDCRAVAAAAGRPLKEIIDEAMRLWRAGRHDSSTGSL
jgi:uncharacterized protein (DUF111 family)